MPIVRKKAPYGGTEKDPETTMADINKMLKAYGVSEMQWTTFWESHVVELRFAIKNSDGKRIGVKLVPPAFAAKRKTWNAKKGKYEIIDAPNWSQSMRLLYWFLKSKLEAVAYGLRDFESEFLGDLIVKLPDGRESTVSEAFKNRLPGLELPELDEGDEK